MSDEQVSAEPVSGAYAQVGGDGERVPRRPVILVPARFSESASALRYRAEVGARTLVEAVYRAGGEPLLMHPAGVRAEVRARLAIADGVLLPGGGDLDSRWTGGPAHPSLYDVDVDQDAFDLAVADAVLDSGRPLLAICRGAQVVNVVLGGGLTPDLAETTGDHRHRRHRVEVAPGSELGRVMGTDVTVSCYHHQCLGRLGTGLEVVARAADGVAEAVELPARAGWFAGVQWHPEDTAGADPAQAALFAAFVAAAAQASPSRRASELPPSQTTPTWR